MQYVRVRAGAKIQSAELQRFLFTARPRGLNTAGSRRFRVPTPPYARAFTWILHHEVCLPSAGAKSSADNRRLKRPSNYRQRPVSCAWNRFSKKPAASGIGTAIVYRPRRQGRRNTGKEARERANKLPAKFKLFRMVGAAGFEPATSCSQSRRATRLRYAPSYFKLRRLCFNLAKA